MNPHERGWYWVRSLKDRQPSEWQVKWFSGTHWNIYIPQSNDDYLKIFEIGPYIGLEPAPMAAPPVAEPVPVSPVVPPVAEKPAASTVVATVVNEQKPG